MDTATGRKDSRAERSSPSASGVAPDRPARESARPPSGSWREISRIWIHSARSISGMTGPSSTSSPRRRPAPATLLWRSEARCRGVTSSWRPSRRMGKSGAVGCRYAGRAGRVPRPRVHLGHLRARDPRHAVGCSAALRLTRRCGEDLQVSMESEPAGRATVGSRWVLTLLLSTRSVTWTRFGA